MYGGKSVTEQMFTISLSLRPDLFLFEEIKELKVHIWKKQIILYYPGHH